MKGPQRRRIPATPIWPSRCTRNSTTTGSSRAGKSPLPIVLAGPALIATGLIAIWSSLAAPGAPLALINTTPSEPIGLYWRTTQAPGPGRLIAFPPPIEAAHVADGHLARLHSFLKIVDAGGGDVVCAEGDALLINGAPRGRIAAVDSTGRPLPQWRGCRMLRSDELFVLSNRVPNSFDSRYFGPVSLRSVIGVYRPLWVSQ